MIKTLGEWTLLILKFLILIVVVLGTLYSCFNDWLNYSFSRNIETYEEWAEYHHSGIKYDEFIFSQDNEKIRLSFVEHLNEMYMKIVHGGEIPTDPEDFRIKEMVSTLDDGNTLIIYNLGNLMDTDQREFTDGYFDKIIEYQINSLSLDDLDSAIFGFIDGFFTKLIIHNEYHDGIRFTHQDRDELECSGTAMITDIGESLARMATIKEKATELKDQKQRSRK
jgi:hypothetical protein